MAAPTLIYCAAGNRRFMEIAVAAGFQYGAQLPGTVYGPLFFGDQNWRRPQRAAYMAALAVHRPHMATVLDWEYIGQLPEILDWAEEAAQYVECVVIVPKVMGGIDRLPRRIGGRDVVLGLSVPSGYGGTELPLWEFAGQLVHLLGGQPHVQMHYWQHLSAVAEVVSTDGNVAQKMATRWCQFWTPGTAWGAHSRYWPRLWEADGDKTLLDAPYEAFRRSCANIRRAWEKLCQST